VSYTLHHGDCLHILRTLPDNSVDAVVTDPPYGLEFMGKEWDAPWKQAPNSWAERDATDHAQPDNRGQTASPFLAAKVNKYAAGLPFQQWCELWAAECLRVLKPGGHLLAFGGTRTWHRLACAIEDAGFEVRDSIAWLYGSGFPKSLDVSKAIDKRGGNIHLASEIAAAIKESRLARGWTTGQADRHFCGGSTNWTWFEGRKGDCRPPTPDTFARIVEEWPELAALAEKVAEAEREVVGNKQAGMGSGQTFGMLQSEGRNGEGPNVVDITAPATPDAERWQGWGTALKPAHEPIVVARKPLGGTVAANVLTHGTGALNIDACRIGETRAVPASHSKSVSTVGAIGISGKRLESELDPNMGRWPANVVLDADMADVLDQQSVTLTSPSPYERGETKLSDQRIYGGGKGIPLPSAEGNYGDTGGASRFFYVAKADASERVCVNGTAHPTVKPLALMRWLVRLVTPPGGTVLEPFAGSGTTVEACILEGFSCIAIEREADYLPLIQQRINRRRDPVAAVKATGDDGGLFDLLDGGAA
jgi:DNA modification methylase